MNAGSVAFSYFYKICEKCEITLPLEREHDFTGYEYPKLHPKTIRNAYKIDASKNCTESMENLNKMELKAEPKSI